jgi:nicotinate phosphoribosyltransferase
MRADWLGLEGDRLEGETLLLPAMRGGRRIAPAEPLQRSRERALGELGRLPQALKSLEPATAYPVTVSEALKDLAREVDRLEADALDRPKPVPTPVD